MRTCENEFDLMKITKELYQETIHPKKDKHARLVPGNLIDTHKKNHLLE